MNTNSGERTGASSWGGAGYGGSNYTSSDGGKTRIAGYGSGQTCSPADDDAGNITKPGEGIFVYTITTSQSKTDKGRVVKLSLSIY